MSLNATAFTVYRIPCRHASTLGTDFRDCTSLPEAGGRAWLWTFTQRRLGADAFIPDPAGIPAFLQAILVEAGPRSGERRLGRTDSPVVIFCQHASRVRYPRFFYVSATYIDSQLSLADRQIFTHSCLQCFIAFSTPNCTKSESERNDMRTGQTHSPQLIIYTLRLDQDLSSML